MRKHRGRAGINFLTVVKINDMAKVGNQNERVSKRGNVFISKLERKWGKEWIMVGEYNHSREFNKFKHSRCGMVLDRKPSYMLDDKCSCVYCAGRKAYYGNNLKLTNPLIASYWDYGKNNLKPNEVTENSKWNIWWICQKCDCSYRRVLYSQNEKGLCINCRPMKPRRTHKEYKKLINEKYDDEWELIGKYVKASEKIKVKHKCGNIEFKNADLLLRESGCRKCGYNFTYKTLKDFNKRLFSKYGNEWVVISGYKGIKSRLKVMHSKCGQSQEKSADNLLHNGGCMYCKESKGAKLIKDYLVDNNILFQQEKWFANCRNIKPLLFDFFLPSCNLLIEFQGEQHVKSVDFFGGDKGLEKRQKRDNIKKNWVEKSPYKLLEIWWNEKKNIASILDKELSVKKPKGNNNQIRQLTLF